MGRGHSTTIGEQAAYAGCLAVPDSGRGRGVVVLAPSPSLAVAACERLAREGFVALAPDAASSDPEADLDARPAVDAAIGQLFREHATQGECVGVLGLGRSAGLALDAAGRDTRIAAVAVLGGVPEAEAAEIAAPRSGAPVLLVLGEKDEAGSAAARCLEERLREAGAHCDLRLQPGAAAEFHDEELADVYDASAAAVAWDAVLARLRADLA